MPLVFMDRPTHRKMSGLHATTDRERERDVQEEQLRSIIEQLADGIVIVGDNGVIRFANPAAERLFGRSVQSLIGTDFGFPIARAEATEVDVVRPGGETITAELRVVEIAWGDNAAKLVSVRDITDRRRAEERARQFEIERVARAEAEAANQAKSDFLATMSHELRTPLNAVIGYAGLLDLGIGGELSPDQRRHVDRIRVSSQHLLSLVREVLDLARVDAGRLSVQLGAFAAARTVEEAVSLLQPAAEARGIALDATGPDATHLAYLGDEDRVRQILVNLLTNAVKFTDPPGAIRLEWGEADQPEPNARLHGEGPWIYFRIHDTGIGIPTDQLSRIFEPFVQLRTRHARPNDGSGLGLAISRRLARVMRGDLCVKSVVGTGTAFTLWLPSQASEIPERREAPRPVLEGGSGRLADVGELLLRELEPIIETFVSRVRLECPAPGAESLKFSQLANHMASFLADVAGMMITLDESTVHSLGAMRDGLEIQQRIAQHHGLHRSRLGWSVDAVRCEYRILSEEIFRVVHRPARTIGMATIDEAMRQISQLLTEAEQTAVDALRGVGRGN
jgi:signal transduction histidine kinase